MCSLVCFRRSTLLSTTLLAIAALSLGCTPLEDPVDGGPSDELALSVAAGAAVPDEGDAPPAITPELPDSLKDDLTLLEAPLLAMPDGLSAKLFLDLPEGVEAVVLLASAHEGTHVILERATGPEGEVLVNDRIPAGLTRPEREAARGFVAQFFSDNRVIPAREAGAFLVPNTPDVPFGPGRYTLRFSTWAVRQEGGRVEKDAVSRPLRVAALVRHRPATPPGAAGSRLGGLQLTMHLTGAAGLTAESAPADETLQAALEVVRETFGSVGIALDEVSYVDVEQPGFSTLVLGEGCEGGDLDELMRASASSPPGIPVFVVERFQCLYGDLDVGQGLGGMSTGLPGPPWVRGSLSSGLAIATAPFVGDSRQLGVVLAHELGHLLGLYHTKENDLFGGPTIYDRISDTPDDERAAENLMYFLATDTTTLSDGQASVLRASPWVLP